ncbi:imidazole glycerol phosphate synthase subunit HisH [Thalassotalea sp. HSM 43]|uniref:imidazole glycerol phosphate synthase subunit HisH n=1 Tax=Thalassotalea sp. HSM 43 TaxID=2552945 RepID=UPI001E33B494|nr:imidazole glycerol phosphate synthase subunit HisH [Thalassotalea sp. HSM 43]
MITDSDINTSTPDALIIDTGCANINSLKFALQRLGYNIVVSDDHDAIKAAKKVFLPGVGAAAYAMAGIKQKRLDALVPTLSQPLLGICLGMQLLTKQSTENEQATDCLGIIDSQINAIENTTEQALRMPHMGWNNLGSIANSPLFTGITEQDYFYFVHSYCAPVGDATLAQCHYGQAFSASLARDNFYGVQFHPERSGKSGAKLLKNFMENC